MDDISSAPQFMHFFFGHVSKCPNNCPSFLVKKPKGCVESFILRASPCGHFQLEEGPGHFVAEVGQPSGRPALVGIADREDEVTDFKRGAGAHRHGGEVVGLYPQHGDVGRRSRPTSWARKRRSSFVVTSMIEAPRTTGRM